VVASLRVVVACLVVVLPRVDVARLVVVVRLVVVLACVDVVRLVVVLACVVVVRLVVVVGQRMRGHHNFGCSPDWTKVFMDKSKLPVWWSRLCG